MQKFTNVVWLLLDSRQLGGIETHVLQLAEGLKEHNINTHVVFLTNYGPHPLRVALQKKGIDTISLDGKLFSLWKEIRQQSPALIHTHGYKAGIFGRICARLSSTPVVSTYHSGEAKTGRLALYDCLDRYSAILASKVYVVSPDIGRRLPIASELANNFVSTKNLPISNGRKIAFVGRLSKEKGPDIFLRLARYFPNVLFHIYGTGPLENKLKRAASSNVCFHGQQSEMSEVWPEVGLLILPSRFEGLPMAALEAMGRAIPVMAFNVGALSNLISNNQNGWILEPLNLEQLSNQFLEWLEMKGTRKKLFKRAARNTVESKFSSHVIIPSLINTYKDLARC